MNKSMQPAIIGGVVLGLLSAIPFVNIVNACCCGWAVLGGMLAGYLYIKGSQTPVTTGEGAKVGVIAGAIGAVIYVVVGLPLGLLSGQAMMAMITSMIQNANPEQGELLRRQMEIQQNMPMGTRILTAIPGTLFVAALIIGFATIGGLLAVAIFEKRKGMSVPPPPPPPAYGGGQPGGGYGGGYGGV
ncbi:MAG TPA: hypothetical protein VK619_19755 [Pyrinomonadaceae bacterium]|nr:hypothetical protein [Pyrinomonadaceae bacterium]